MVSGSFPVANNSSGTETEIRYAETVHESANTSDVAVSLYARTSVGTFGDGTWILRIGVQTFTRSSRFNGSTDWERVANAVRYDTPHTSDGGLNIPVGVESGGISGTSWSSTSGTRDVEFEDIDREPGKISGLESTGGYREISGTWPPASTPSGLPILEYRYRYSSNTGYTDGGTASVGKSRSFSHSVAKDSTRYYWSVSARNADGWGPWSGNASVYSLPPLPAAPSGLTTKNHTASSFLIEWDAVSGASSYDLEIADNAQYTNAGSASKTTTDHETTGKDAGTNFWVRVRSRNQSGVSAWSTVSTATAPNVPRSLTITDTQSDYITFTWSAPSPNGNRSITGYDIDVSTSPAFTAGTTSTKSVGATTRAYTMDGLEPGGTYYVRVRAKNSAAPGAYTGSKSTTTVLAGGWIKTGANTWTRTKGVHVKTGPSTWKRAIRVWIKTGPSTWE